MTRSRIYGIDLKSSPLLIPSGGRIQQRFADEIALYGTVTSLLPNILDFRPIALLSNFKDGMVSIQLNPRKVF